MKSKTLSNIPKQNILDLLRKILIAGGAFGTLIVSQDPTNAPAIFATIIDQFWTSPFAKKQNEYLLQVANQLDIALSKINEIDGLLVAGINDIRFMSRLAERDDFQAILARGYDSYKKNYRQRKREAIANGVASTAIWGSVEEELETVFFDLLDKFTIWHLEVLDNISLTYHMELDYGHDNELAIHLENQIPELRG